jgi:hypothetical protein
MSGQKALLVPTTALLSCSHGTTPVVVIQVEALEMGWDFRKSLRAGPVRVNVSKSGIGGSAGVPGARVGVGPRGPYVAGGLS